MDYIEYAFTTEMAMGDYIDENFTITLTAASPHDAIVELVAERVEEIAHQENFEVAKAKAEQYIAEKLGMSNWTPEQFCEAWIKLWASEYQLIRVYAMKQIRIIRLSDELLNKVV